MKKVLIISYFYPPSNFVGGERTEAWFNHLQNEGFYPIIVTRCWNKEQSDLIGKPEHNEYTVEKLGNGEIHRVPVPKDLRNTVKGPLRKLISLRRLLKRNLSAPMYEFKNLYEKCVELVQADKEIKTVIASGRPFESFQIGHLLKKKFDITWVPDYRDEWSTHTASATGGWFWRKIKDKERAFEKRWTSNADFFTTVSEQWSRSIGAFIGKNGFVIKNGIKTIPEVTSSSQAGDKNEFIITYVGTVYPNQPFDPTFRVLKKIISQTEMDVKVYLLGTETIPQERDKLKSMVSDFDKNFIFIDRLPSDELKEYLEISDVFFLTSYPGLSGVLPVKIYDYLAYRKPVILYPTDDDLMEEFIRTNNNGFIPNSEKEYLEVLVRLSRKKMEVGKTTLDIDRSSLEQYTREYQTKKLAELLKNNVL